MEMVFGDKCTEGKLDALLIPELGGWEGGGEAGAKELRNGALVSKQNI